MWGPMWGPGGAHVGDHEGPHGLQQLAAFIEASSQGTELGPCGSHMPPWQLHSILKELGHDRTHEEAASCRLM